MTAPVGAKKKDMGLNFKFLASFLQRHATCGYSKSLRRRRWCFHSRRRGGAPAFLFLTKMRSWKHQINLAWTKIFWKSY